MKLLVFACLLVVASLGIHAQETTTFSTGASFRPYPCDILALANGNYLVTADLASSADLFHNWPNYRMLAEVTPAGDTLWTTVESQEQYGAYRMLEATDGGFVGLGLRGVYVCGSTFVTSPFGQTESGVWLADGTQASNEEVGLGCTTFLKGAANTGSDIYAVHEVRLGLFGSSDDFMALYHLDSTGEVSTQYLPITDATGMALDEDGMLVLNGPALHKLTLDGTQVWTATLEVFNGEHKLVAGEPGVAVVHDNTWADGDTHVQMVAYETGAQLWQLTLDFDIRASAYHPSGAYVFVGEGEQGAQAAVIDPFGNVVYQQAWTMGLDGMLTQIHLTESGFWAAGMVKQADEVYDVLIVHPDQEQVLLGCLDDSACNYQPEALIDAGCSFPGCADDTALNYDPEAGCASDTCIYEFACMGDADGDGVISASDLTAYLGALGTTGPSPFDGNGDGVVSFEDFLDALGAFGTECE